MDRITPYSFAVLVTNALDVIDDDEKVNYIFQNFYAYIWLLECKDSLKGFLDYCSEQFEGQYDERLARLFKDQLAD